MVGRRWWVVAAVTLCGLTLSGCSVPVYGYVGVGRDTDRSLVVYLRTCDRPMDGATLYWPDDPDGASSSEEVFAEWSLGPQADPGRAQWPLLGGTTNGVVPRQPLTTIPGPPKTMAIFAGTDDNTASAHGPYTFTAEDLERLGPGEVLVQNTTGNEDDPRNKTVTREAFDAIDCSAEGFG